MAADVSSLIGLTSSDSDNDQKSSSVAITRDLLGGSFGSDDQELDLDMEVPPGWEKRLDLKSGRVYLQRCNLPSAAPSFTPLHKQQEKINQTVTDLNSPPSPMKPLINFLDNDSLDLKLSSQRSAFSSSCNYQSVCTLDKVKNALEKAEKDIKKKRTLAWKSSPSSPPLHSSPSSSTKETDQGDEENDDKFLLSPAAATCPSCLLYVLVSRNNPKCPRCNMVVPLVASKKPRIDLNLSFM